MYAIFRNSMSETGKYIRRTISISPRVNEILSDGANNEFGGNFSAFLAHIVLDYAKCRNCYPTSPHVCEISGNTKYYKTARSKHPPKSDTVATHVG